MPYILGLDTGGTYTDGVLVDTRTENVVSKAKALTTKHDLRIGIEACIDALDIRDYSEIKMVALSTTLATNAVVENRCGKTGLILIGRKRHEVMPTEYIEIIDGEMDIKGNVILPVSEKQAKAAVLHLKDKVEAIAVSAYASVRNPQEELKVKRIVEENAELPVFCAHELSGSLGYAERTTTAVLNAGLTGIIRDFIKATRQSLGSRNINADMMIVKSDGSLMREEAALKRPVDTILSGPAASAIGARKLTGIDNALILDMGGTTVDIADISGGQIKTGDDCARVAGWDTKVHAVEISTHGIGGDSLISVSGGESNETGKISVEPQKAEPVSRISYYHDNISAELEGIRKDTALSDIEKAELGRCYCLIKSGSVISGSEKSLYNNNTVHDSIVKILEKAPHSLAFIIDTLNNDSQHPDSETGKTTTTEPVDIAGKKKQIADIIKRMIRDKEINTVDITPTDILHISDRYNEWDKNAALTRAEMLAAANNMTLEEFRAAAEQAVYKRIYTACIQAVADFEQANTDMYTDRAAKYLIDKQFDGSNTEFLSAGCRLRKPLVAVGAPVRAWLPYICKKMNAELILPDDADVANAIGSAFGEIAEFAEGLIRREKGKRRYNLYLPDEKKSFSSRKAALEEAERALHEIVMRKAQSAGCPEPEITVESRDVYTQVFGEKGKQYVETGIKAYAKGRPGCWMV